MKKILVLSLHLGYGGVEKSIVALANLLCKKYNVEIACTYKLNDKPAFNIDDKVKITYLTDVIPNKKEFKTALKKKNIFKILHEGIKSIYILNQRKKTMIEYIKSTNSDIIISTRCLFNKWLGKYSKENIKKIGWEHNHYHGNMKYANKVIKSVKNFDYLVLVSKNLRDFYSGKLSSVKCVYIPNIIDDIPRIKSDLTSKNLVSVGRLSKEKGYMDLVLIFEKLLKKYPDYKLNIIGDGEEKENIQKYIKEKKLENNIILHGFKSKEYINKILLNSSIYLMASYTESFGIVLIEAMSYGLPCIAYSSAEGANELIKNGKNGYLIDNRNEKEFIKKIEYLINNENKRNEMKEECINTASKFTSKTIIKSWEEIL